MGDEVGNAVRNERQKALLLAEVSRMRRDELSSLVETSKAILERSKKLCENSSSEAPSRSRRAG
jgi:hypothetical protein